MTFAKYGPRTNVHDTRYGAVKSAGPNLWAILHTSEGGELTNSAEALSSFMTTPATATNVASYHAVFDTDRVLPAVPYDTVAYSAAGGNAQGVHGCFPGKAGQTRTQWLDTNSRAMIRQAAAWLCDVSVQLNIPLAIITPAQMVAKARGIGDHYTVTQAFRKTNHTDVGAGFPWDVLFADIDALTQLYPPVLPAPILTSEVQVLNVLEALMSPTRFYDSRPFGGPFPAGQYSVMAPGVAGKKAVEVGVKIIGAGVAGYATVWPGTVPAPAVSQIDFAASGASNTVMTVPVAADGSFKVYVSQNAGIVIDLYGYWT